MLSSAEWADVRSFATLALVQTAEIQRVSRVSDGSLGWTETWQTVATVGCRVKEQNDGRGGVTVAGVQSSTGQTFVYLPYGTELNEADRLKVTVHSRVRMYTVDRIIETSHATLLTVLVSEVRSG